MATVPKRAVEFAGYVLMHCANLADGNRKGELVCPFAIIEEEGERQVVEFEAGTQEEAVARGQASLDDYRDSAERWGFAREGVYQSGGKGHDVLVVTVWIEKMEVPASVIQKFGRDDGGALYMIGTPDLITHVADVARHVLDWDRADLVKGVISHPRGDKWAQWQPQ
jgi:hypothetical protein